MYGRTKGDPASIWQYIFPHDITVDADHNVWWAEFQGGHIGRLTQSTGKMDRFPMDPEKKSLTRPVSSATHAPTRRGPIRRATSGSP